MSNPKGKISLEDWRRVREIPKWSRLSDAGCPLTSGMATETGCQKGRGVLKGCGSLMENGMFRRMDSTKSQDPRKGLLKILWGTKMSDGETKMRTQTSGKATMTQTPRVSMIRTSRKRKEWCRHKLTKSLFLSNKVHRLVICRGVYTLFSRPGRIHWLLYKQCSD